MLQLTTIRDAGVSGIETPVLFEIVSGAAMLEDISVPPPFQGERLNHSNVDCRGDLVASI
jgi:hypothetical protein